MLEEDDEFVSAEVYITPPDQGEVTDEDSGPEDDDGTIDRLSGAQLRSEAEVIVQQYHDVRRVGDENLEDNEAAESTSEDTLHHADRFTVSFYQMLIPSYI